MHMIEAIVRPSAVERITRGLCDAGIHGCTALEAKGYGRQKGHTERYRGGRMDVGFVPKVMLRVAVKDTDVDRAMGVIGGVTRTGKTGDGKVFVWPLDHAVRIRTGEKDDNAL